MMANIELMFHQVKVHPDDCDLLRFLWGPGGNIDGNLKEYRMVVHERRHLHVALAMH